MFLAGNDQRRAPRRWKWAVTCFGRRGQCNDGANEGVICTRSVAVACVRMIGSIFHATPPRSLLDCGVAQNRTSTTAAACMAAQGSCALTQPSIVIVLPLLMRVYAGDSHQSQRLTTR